MVIWIIGLAGAGKTTLGVEVARQLRSVGRAVVLLDGDAVRAAIAPELGYTTPERAQHGQRIGRLCALLETQGVTVVACVLANEPDQQRWNRATFERYLEVFLDPAAVVVEARDQKGLYSGARAGRVRDVVGVDIPFVRPTTPDIVLAGTDALAPPEVSAARILGAVVAVQSGGAGGVDEAVVGHGR
jgi:cytidine diphosphoramidate kinase